MNRIALFAAGLIFAVSSIAQLKSPEQFLGYQLGTRYTPHWKITSYFEYLSTAMPEKVRLQPYGRTYEGRPLFVVFISDQDHISNLESVRLNNLRLALLTSDKMAPRTDLPVITWLSYNVHGNEASSSETAMLTAYTLLKPENRQASDWLKKTVVVIDPCLNPDGRDRYVNWFQSVVGIHPNPRMDTREHREPWPGGRTNHYNFDLNRDWAWQTQDETIQRIQLYNQWMPQIHVDFHEQGINEPYYFAPAAEPIHDVVTPWQRSFQTTIGKNHARYFDANGWLYFTRLRFDLFYPSYGDTYPMYNGAIGMTYEQAGHSASGTRALTEEGDTLTLNDRILHHHTTGLSTVEMVAAHASKIIQEYRSYFQKGVENGYGTYKTYIVKKGIADAERFQSLLRLLDKNGIQYKQGTGTGIGYNYTTGKDESFTIEKGDLVISNAQPRSALVQVLFEPRSNLSDSATYDITAWSIPYVYGLQAFACKNRITGLSEFVKEAPVHNLPVESYAYIIQWQGVQSAKAVGKLLQKGLLLRYSEVPFEVDGQKFNRGAVLILKAGNAIQGKQLAEIVAEVGNETGVAIHTVSTGFVDKGADFGSDLVHSLRYKRVVLLTGDGTNSNAVGELWHFFDQQLEYPVSLVQVADWNRLDWNHTDVLILPDGNYRFLTDKNAVERLHDWVSKGGKLIALESAVAAIAKLEWGLKSKKTEDVSAKDVYDPLKSFENRERDYITSITPGSVYKLQIDNTHPLAFGYPSFYFTLKQDDRLYEFMGENGWNVGVIKQQSQIAGFVGSKLKERMKDGLLIGAQNIGNGSVVFLSDNVLFRSFWENGKLFLCNALFF